MPEVFTAHQQSLITPKHLPSTSLQPVHRVVPGSTVVIMSSSSLISTDLSLHSACLSTEDIPSDEKVTVLSAFSAYGLDNAAFLSSALDVQLPSDSDNYLNVANARGIDAAVVTEAPRNLLILDAEPFDSPKDNREEGRELSWHLSLSISDAILFSVNLRDISRFHTNGLGILGASITQMLLLQADKLVPTRVKRAFILVVRDYESDIISRRDLISGFLQEMQACYSEVAKPPRSAQRVSDIFEFSFTLLPSQQLAPEEYDTAISNFKTQLLDPVSDNYLFERSAYSHDLTVSIPDSVDNVWKKLTLEQTRDIPAKKELMSSFDCDNAMRKVFEKYERGVRVWRREADGGVIIDRFGEAADEMVKQTIEVFDKDASPHKGSSAFRRKRQELKDLLDADLYNLFVVQIAKLRDVTYRVFKEKLDTLGEGDARLEREVNVALKESQRSFRSNAEALRPSFSSWRFDNDAKELASQMREDATDKLQRARISDYQESGGRRGRRRRGGMAAAGPKRRQPISLGIHYLDPAPFGIKDSRYEKLNVEDPMGYNSGALPAASGSGASSGGLSVPIMPSRDSGWHRKNQDFIYTERK